MIYTANIRHTLQKFIKVSSCNQTIFYYYELKGLAIGVEVITNSSLNENSNFSYSSMKLDLAGNEAP